LQSAIFTPDNQLIAQDYKSAKLFDWTGKKLRSFLEPLGGISALGISKSGSYLLTGTEHQTVKLWNLREKPHNQDVYTLEVYGKDKEAKGKQEKSYVSVVKIARKNVLPTASLSVQADGKKAMDSMIEEYKLVKRLRIDEERKRLALEADWLRSFSISRFGIYNSDRIYPNTNNLTFAADFDCGDNTNSQDIAVFLISGEKGTVVIPYNIGLGSENFGKFTLNPNHANKLLVIKPNHKVLVIKAEEVSHLDFSTVAGSGFYTFRPQKTDQWISNLNELRALLR
jgi:WD40 repeat protein